MPPKPAKAGGLFSKLARRRKDRPKESTGQGASSPADVSTPPSAAHLQPPTAGTSDVLPIASPAIVPEDLQHLDPYAIISDDSSKKPSSHQLRDSAWEGCKLALRLLNEVSEFFGPLEAAVGAFCKVVDVIEDVSSNKDQYTELDRQLRAFTAILVRYKNQELPVHLQRRLDGIARVLAQQSDFIKQKIDAGLVKRILDSSQGAEEIANCFRTLSSLITMFQLDMGINTELQTESIIKHLTRTDNARILEKLPRVQDASFRSGNRTECMKGTRTAVLADLMAWATDRSSHRVYWLNGLAGTGKSTIAQSFCALLDSNDMLACSYFCSRNSSLRRDVSRIIPTICFSLSRMMEQYAKNLLRVLADDSDVVHYSLLDQFSQLLVEPLRLPGGVPEKYVSRSIIIVIDALDECDSPNATEQLLSAILRNTQGLPLKFFVSSRPETHIWEQFSSSPSLRTILRLHDIEAKIVRDDINLYLVYQLAQISAKKRYNDWPSSQDISELVHRSDKLFIYAFMTVQYVSEAPNPKKRLQSLLKRTTNSALQTAVLDDLYSIVMGNAFANLEQEEMDELRQLLHCVVCLTNPLSIPGISLLLGRDDSVADDLRRFQSLLRLPQDENSLDPVQVFHASFPDYLGDPVRSSHLAIDPRATNAFLALKCLELLNSQLKENLCSAVRTATAADLNARMREKQGSDALSYAAIHFASHLSLAEAENRSVTLYEATTFITMHLLHWVECLSINGSLGSAYKAIAILESCIAHSIYDYTHSGRQDDRSSSTDPRRLCDDTRRLLQQSFDFVEQYPLEIYHSALVWLPKNTLLEPERDARADRLPKVLHGIDSSWSECESVLLHPGVIHISKRGAAAVEGLALSSDESLLLTGHSTFVYIWDMATGQRIKRFDGHTDRVSCVLWGLKGRIWSCSHDCTIRAWDVESGDTIKTLDDHTDRVHSIILSDDDKHLASASRDCTIRIWDTENYQCSRVVGIGSSEGIDSVALSPDSKIIASAARDGISRLLDASTGELLHELKAHESIVWTVSFSPDGSTLVTGSKDRTLCFWDLRTAQPSLIERKSMGTGTPIMRACFSPSGSMLALGCGDGTLRLLDVHSRETIHTFEAYATVASIVFFADESKLIGGFLDMTARVFRVRLNQTLEESVGSRMAQRLMVTAMVLSSDRKWLATASHDNSIHFWDAETGEGKMQCNGHIDMVEDMALIPEKDHFVSAARDNTLRLWRPGRPNCIRVLEGHTDALAAVKVSPDGKLIASAGDDYTVRIWAVDDLDSSPRVLTVPYDPFGLAYSSDGALLAVGLDNLGIVIWNTSSWTEVLSLTNETSDDAERRLVFSADNQEVATATRNGHAHVVNISTGERRGVESNTLQHMHDGSIVLHKRGQTSISLVDPTQYFVPDNRVIQRLRDDGSIETVCHIVPSSRDIEVDLSDGTMLYLGHNSGMTTTIDMSAYENFRVVYRA